MRTVTRQIKTSGAIAACLLIYVYTDSNMSNLAAIFHPTDGQPLNNPIMSSDQGYVSFQVKTGVRLYFATSQDPTVSVDDTGSSGEEAPAVNKTIATKIDNYASVAGDWNGRTIIDVNAATAKTVTIPATAFADAVVGTVLAIQWTWGAVGNPVIAAGAGTTIAGTITLAAAGATVKLMKTGAGALSVIA